ncbi:type 1 glutamine amidotransferase [Mycobacterium sp. CBMA293]|uniref:type 1 glutamine amidotransferase n=1 Tax=unclassified Mycolicibacterium TaxID=2636767 RepID=UPI00132721AE|nr:MULTISPECIES: type 1 glutamine amidotransferase [unclassified Mycolicibacterium]MUL47191.1 type 1 glutamine amidotransferase [Mycolicibacterium sp. CBMA 360]MUL96202.1 type 1 glutamine amidotransferase [Mycolicibacterium sp. CBMA 230]MUM31940.1 type 1 glutamine amidotransferase [Mycolicibacterium sp. CBMA 361]MUL61300.1 type 1 glutamine amidotransferase [Mycolicibacterium sp. CBMA 335]MUL72035.1 type 1 glutamine amidotransferase [Mycolicibacterium sp. CBMA 311]
MTSRVLFVRNDPVAPEAMLADAFSECGFDIDTFDVVPPGRVGAQVGAVEFPDLTRYDVVVVLGARWSVYDEALRASWVGTLMTQLREAADAGVGLFGVCFGGQLLAQTFGGAVSRSDSPEVGWYELSTDEPELIPPGPWFEWHVDSWTLPPGATEIARTAGASQAFVLGRTLALQFHPELDGPVLEEWIADDTDGLVTKVGRTDDELRIETKELSDDAAQRVRALVRNYLSRVLHAS